MGRQLSSKSKVEAKPWEAKSGLTFWRFLLKDLEISFYKDFLIFSLEQYVYLLCNHAILTYNHSEL